MRRDRTRRRVGVLAAAVLAASLLATSNASADIVASRSLVDFGNQHIGTASVPERIVVSGTSSFLGDSIGSVAIVGQHPGDFQKTRDDCSGRTLQTNETCWIDVRFEPTALGARHAVLRIPSSSNDLFIDLRGTGADLTPPVVDVAVSPPANGAGWHSGDVHVDWTVTDPESGISSTEGCGNTTLTDETPGTTLTCSATNGWGLGAARSVEIRIDTTPPTTTIDGPLGLSAPTGEAVDGLSGVVQTSVTFEDVVFGGTITVSAGCTSGCGTDRHGWTASTEDVPPGLYRVTASSVDRAGNTGPSSSPVIFLLT